MSAASAERPKGSLLVAVLQAFQVAMRMGFSEAVSNDRCIRCEGIHGGRPPSSVSTYGAPSGIANLPSSAACLG